MDRATKAAIWHAEIDLMLDGKQTVEEAVRSARVKIRVESHARNAASDAQDGERATFEYEPRPDFIPTGGSVAQNGF